MIQYGIGYIGDYTYSYCYLLVTTTRTRLTLLLLTAAGVLATTEKLMTPKHTTQNTAPLSTRALPTSALAPPTCHTRTQPPPSHPIPHRATHPNVKKITHPASHSIHHQHANHHQQHAIHIPGMAPHVQIPTRGLELHLCAYGIQPRVYYNQNEETLSGNSLAKQFYPSRSFSCYWAPLKVPCSY